MAQTSQWRIVDLGPLGFVADPDAIGTLDINDSRQVAYPRAFGGVVRPAVWLPEAAYGLPPGTTDLLAAFGITGWTTGAAFDINDAGIVVGQVGGFERNVAGSRAAWWDLVTMTWETVAPQAPPGGGAPEPWQDWTRSIAVSEGPGATMLVETWVEDQCFIDCGAPITTMYGYVSTAIVPVGTAAVTTLVTSPDCNPAPEARDIRRSGGISELIGATVSAESRVEIRDKCTVTPLPCDGLINGYTWIGGTPVLVADFDDQLTLPGRGSQGRGYSTGGEFVGWGYNNEQFCRLQPLAWEDATNFTVLPTDWIAPGEVENARAEGRSESPEARAVGWGIAFEEPLLWRESMSGTWDVLLLRSGIAVGLPVRAATCLDAALGLAFDVTPDEWIVVAGFGSGPEGGPLSHTYVLVPIDPQCPSDTDQDGDVDLADLLKILATFGDPGCACSLCPGDTDADGAVDFDDLIAVLGNWGDCTTPEGLPQSIQDCVDRYGLDPVALAACINSLGTQSP